MDLKFDVILALALVYGLCNVGLVNTQTNTTDPANSTSVANTTDASTPPSGTNSTGATGQCTAGPGTYPGSNGTSSDTNGTAPAGVPASTPP